MLLFIICVISISVCSSECFEDCPFVAGVVITIKLNVHSRFRCFSVKARCRLEVNSLSVLAVQLLYI